MIMDAAGGADGADGCVEACTYPDDPNSHVAFTAEGNLDA
jgi:hypothetical protein